MVMGRTTLRCPNHHALFDLAVPRFIDEQTVEVNGERFSLTLRHAIAEEHIRYYSEEIQSSHGRKIITEIGWPN